MEFSVVIPTYNRVKYLPETLDSILNQTSKPKEIIVVDDGSTDGTSELFSSKSYGVRYLKIKNSGPGVARCLGMRSAKSEWIAFCDSDDIWEVNHLETIGNVAAAFPDSKFIFTNFCNFSEENPGHLYYDHFASAPSGWWERQILEKKASYWKLVDDIFLGFLEFNPAWPTPSVVHRSIAQKVGKTPAGISRLPSEDGDLTGRFFALSKVACAEDKTVRLRKHSFNYSGNQVDNIIGRANVLMLGLMEHKDIYGKYECEIINEVKRDVLRAFQRALWDRNLVEAGQLYSLLKDFKIRPPSFKQRHVGRCCEILNIVAQKKPRKKLDWLIKISKENLCSIANYKPIVANGARLK